MSSSTLEESLRRYLMSFDGKKKEFSPSLKRAFDSVYHKEFYNRTSKYAISRDKLLQIQMQHLTSGTRVLLVSFHPISSSRILYKLCIIPKDASCYQTYHNVTEVKDGKIIRPIKSSMKEFDATGLEIVEYKLNAYIALFDGTIKHFSQIEERFDDLYSSEFIEEVANETPVTKEQMRLHATELLFLGTKAKIVSFVPIDASHFKAAIHVQNDFSNTVVESTATIKAGKIVSLRNVIYMTESETSPQWMKFVLQELSI